MSDQTHSPSSPLLSIRELTVSYGTKVAVRSASLQVRSGEKVAIVGESGSGKTTLGNAIGGFIDPLNARVDAHSLEFDGVPLLGGDTNRREDAIPRRRGGISMVFQDAMSSLDPVWTVGSQLVAVLRSTEGSGSRRAREEAKEWLRLVGIPEPGRVSGLRPYQLSGGMRQRVMMAIALASKPKLLVADEPTSALDASMAVKAMRLMVSLAEQVGTAVLVITHDIELCRRFTDYVVVMYKGEIVEQLPSSELDRSEHPYTQGLLRCVPTLEGAALEVLPTLESVRADMAGGVRR